MNREEIDYWLRLFSNNNQCFMSKDGKKITLFKVFQELKELQYLLKIKNDYINEIEKELVQYKKLGFKHLNDKCNKLENQQKEFIEWLTNEANINPYDISDYTYEDIINAILSKYYEIIEKWEKGE